MSLYIDEGDGFSEENKIYKEVCIEDGKFQVEFDLGKVSDIKSLRFDPIEDEIISCCVDNISEGIMISGSNATRENENDYQIFDCLDPQYYFNIVERKTKLFIHGKILIKNEEELKKEIVQKEILVRTEINKKENEIKEEIAQKNILIEMGNQMKLKNQEIMLDYGKLMAKYGYLLTEYKKKFENK